MAILQHFRHFNIHIQMVAKFDLDILLLCSSPTGYEEKVTGCYIHVS